MNDIDLPPHEWTSERPKPKEPIFGAGWPIGLATFAGLLFMAYFADEGRVPVWATIAGIFGAAMVHEFSDSLRR